MLVLCSRNARPEKGLVRRPHLDQHGCSCQERNRRVSQCAQGKTVWPFPESEVEKIPCRVGGLILGSFIDTCSKVHDNARNSGMKK